jgi:hypothetical protein
MLFVITDFGVASTYSSPYEKTLDGYDLGRRPYMIMDNQIIPLKISTSKSIKEKNMHFPNFAHISYGYGITSSSNIPGKFKIIDNLQIEFTDKQKKYLIANNIVPDINSHTFYTNVDIIPPDNMPIDVLDVIGMFAGDFYHQSQRFNHRTTSVSAKIKSELARYHCKRKRCAVAALYTDLTLSIVNAGYFIDDYFNNRFKAVLPGKSLGTYVI